MIEHVRRATLDDAAAVAELAERTFRDTFAHHNRPEDIELHCRNAYGKAIQATEIAAENRVTLVCSIEDRLVGYGMLRWETPPACVIGTQPAEIQRLYVDAPWHGKGVAQALMASLLDVAREGKADVAWLGVWEKNPRAMSFYTKSGFARAGDHVFVVGNDPQRDFILVKKLGGSLR